MTDNALKKLIPAKPIIVVDEELHQRNMKSGNLTHIVRPVPKELIDEWEDDLINDDLPAEVDIIYTAEETDNIFWKFVDDCRGNNFRTIGKKISELSKGQKACVMQKGPEYYEEMLIRLSVILADAGKSAIEITDIIIHFITTGKDSFRAILEEPTLANFFIEDNTINYGISKIVPGGFWNRNLA